MFKRLSGFGLLFFFAIGVSAQNNQITVRPTPQDDKDVVRISTNLIQLDVSVTDKKGNPITDLKPEEVEIYENGKLQRISNFAFTPGMRTVDSKNPKKDSAGTPVVVLPSAPIRPEQVRRTIALVVDDLTLSFGSTVWVREALKKFVDEQMQEGDLVAIIRTGAGVGALQQFTADKRQLQAAINRVKFNSGGLGSLAFFNPLSTSMSETVVNADPRFSLTIDPDPPEGLRSDDSAARNFNEFRENIFASGTLGALNFIVRGMRELPGRKSVILLSDGLSLVTRDGSGRPESSRIYTAMQHLIDFANRASVVFYTIHAPGLIAPGFDAEDDLGKLGRQTGVQASTILLNERLNKIDDSQQGLRYLADETGGLAYFNQNDINTGIRRVLNDQSYYLIGYEPDSDTFNDKQSRYNKFDVKVKREGAQVRFRSGFFGISEEQIVKPKLSVTDAMIGALTSPFAVNDIDVKMNAIFAGDAKQAAFVRTVINVDANDLTFKKLPDGRLRTDFDIVAITLNDVGKIMDERPKNFVLTFDDEQYKKFIERGLVTTFSLPIKKPGAYSVRLAVRDVATERVGSANQFIEVPDLKKNNLTLSGMALENVPFDTWVKIASLPDADTAGAGDSLWDTSARRFKAGSVLRFAYQIHNAKMAGSKAALNYNLKLYSGRDVVFETGKKPITRLNAESPKMISAVGGIKLGESLTPGDYILQVDVIDGGANVRTVTQFIQFEIVE
ncbi:MAG TPA: VWA domain-containing protein [Pyrinomonadaceae bacterium]|nr:VWA domain-containing protein [Acidobacteriota bacterium]HQZ95325.1 VWA domain-containing protein [Pyrinomonadaceae bacterium]